MSIATSPPNLPAALRQLAAEARGMDREKLRERVLGLSRGLVDAPAGRDEAAETVEGGIALCRSLYSESFTGEALLVAGALLALAESSSDSVHVRRAHMLCGLMHADAGDTAGAIEHHVAALRLAIAQGDTDATAKTWNNIGLVMSNSGQYELAVRCFSRGLAAVEAIEGPVFIRYAAMSNLAHCHYHLGQFDVGLAFAQRALAMESPAIRDFDPHGPLYLRRNLVGLQAALGRSGESLPHVEESARLSEALNGPRAFVAAAITRSVHEVAQGRTDIALTRLEGALARARRIPAALRDTLHCLVRAEEAAGNVERALLWLRELSEHVHRQALDTARAHVELAGLAETAGASDRSRDRDARSRLASRVSEPRAPAEWDALQRLAVTAAFRMESSGWHGKRVGALVKAHATAEGRNPLEALEMGLAAEVHDLGMLSMPEALLSKRGNLTSDERGIVRGHSDAGTELLPSDRHPRLLLAREMAAYHHARWDGRGYPESVSGRNIPLPARICAVADAYDAMVCGVGHARARTMEQALDEMRREAGGQFDPQLVESFERMVRSESQDLGVALHEGAGLAGFQQFIQLLQEDRGFV